MGGWGVLGSRGRSCHTPSHAGSAAPGAAALPRAPRAGVARGRRAPPTATCFLTTQEAPALQLGRAEASLMARGICGPPPQVSHP